MARAILDGHSEIAKAMVARSFVYVPQCTNSHDAILSTLPERCRRNNKSCKQNYNLEIFGCKPVQCTKLGQEGGSTRRAKTDRDAIKQSYIVQITT